MGRCLLNNYDLLPGECQTAKMKTYVTEAQQLSVRGYQNSGDRWLTLKAVELEGYSRLLL